MGRAGNCAACSFAEIGTGFIYVACQCDRLSEIGTGSIYVACQCDSGGE